MRLGARGRGGGRRAGPVPGGRPSQPRGRTPSPRQHRDLLGEVELSLRLATGTGGGEHSGVPPAARPDRPVSGRASAAAMLESCAPRQIIVPLCPGLSACTMRIMIMTSESLRGPDERSHVSLSTALGG